MKRYQFPLSTVLRARKAQEDIAKADVLRAHQAAARAAAAVAESRVHYQASAAAAGAEFRAHRQRWELAGQGVADSEATEAEAQKGIEAATARYVAAARAVSVIEHLDDTRREEHTAAVQREEANVVDDLVTSRFVRSRGYAGNQSTLRAGEEGAQA